ncbi:hypothetical protein V8C42DRAFT_332031 [Trichoderma barbatum]
MRPMLPPSKIIKGQHTGRHCRKYYPTLQVKRRPIKELRFFSLSRTDYSRFLVVASGAHPLIWGALLILGRLLLIYGARGVWSGLSGSIVMSMLLFCNSPRWLRSNTEVALAWYDVE